MCLAQGGLVVVSARYGSLEAIHQAELQDRHAVMDGHTQPSPPASSKRFRPQSQGSLFFNIASLGMFPDPGILGSQRSRKVSSQTARRICT